MNAPEVQVPPVGDQGSMAEESSAGNEDLFSALVLPISKFGPGRGGEPEPIAAVGTGFTFGEQTFVTCWHCVRDQLGDGEFYTVAAGSEGTDIQGYDAYFRLRRS